jgi:hypothetical protein
MPPSTEPGADIELLIRSRYTLIILDTVELEQAESIVKQIAARLSLHFYRWTRSKGLLRGAGPGDPNIDTTFEPAAALGMAEREGSGIFLFRGLGPFLEDHLVASHVQDLVLSFATTKRGSLIITGHDVRLPDSLRPYAITVRLPSPKFEEYRSLLEKIVREYSSKLPLKMELSQEDRVRLINNLQGLTLVEAEKVLTRLIIEDGALRPDDISRVITAKRQAVEQDGLLEYHHTQEGMKDVAGMKGLKSWLAKRRAVVADPYKAEKFGLSYPKGVLLLGVPGCGKSLCAKAVACEWGLPLLKLDPANLYDKYVGNSEKNFKSAMSTAERMAPIVLWIDELEKAFGSSQGDEDGGVSRRVFGTFLSWLQDREGDVFVVATSNDVAKLPPEFIRKGRFDEVFFVDLPREDARKAIFEIHFTKRKQNPASFDLPGLVRATEGFSGAEIEQAIVSGLYTAFDGGTQLSTKLLLDEISITRPLSQTMSERLTDLRDWARDRTVAAD